METQDINIVKEMYPNSWTLIKDNKTQSYIAQIVDEELDDYHVEFNGDGCANIKTPLTHIVLRSDDLRALANMIDEAEERYSNE